MEKLEISILNEIYHGYSCVDNINTDNIYELTDEEVESLKTFNEASDYQYFIKKFDKLWMAGNPNKYLTDEEIECLKKLRERPEPEWEENIQSFIKKCLTVRGRTTEDFKVEFNNVEFKVEEDDTEKSLYWKWKYFRDI